MSVHTMEQAPAAKTFGATVLEASGVTMRFGGPVSYTHLTLPTSDLV